MLTTSTIGGVVTRKHSGWLTILLKTGKKERIKYIDTDLKVGDIVAVAFNCHTSQIAGIYSEIELAQKEEMPQRQKQDYPLDDKYYDN